MFSVGVDLGGTKIEAIVLAPDGKELFRERRPTPKSGYEATLAAIVELVYSAKPKLAQHGIELDCADPQKVSIGIGTPGALSPFSGLIKNANSTQLNGKPLDRDLARMFGRPIYIANDANCLVLSEARDGAAAGVELVFGVILGTGVGGAVVTHGHLLTGANAICGEWGHNPMPQFFGRQRVIDRPVKCYCGQAGCIETFLSGPGFAKEAALEMDAPAIIQSMRQGEKKATAAFDRYVDRLARALASVINILDPDVIVLGGGMSLVTELYQRVPERWSAYVFSDHVATKLLPSMHGDSSGVRGAAWLGKD